MEDCLAAAPDDPFRGHDGPLVLERGPARGPLFDAFFAAVQEAGRLTSDVNGYRQRGSPPSTAPQGTPRLYRRGLPPSGHGACEPRVETFALATRVMFEGKRAVGVEYARFGRRATRAREPGGRALRRGDQLAAAAPALRGRGGRRAARSASTWSGPARRGRTCRTTSRSTSSTLHRAGGWRLRSEEPSQGRAWSGCCASQAPAPPTTSRRAASCAATTSRYPNLMYHFLPIAVRYDGTVPPGVGAHGYGAQWARCTQTCAARARSSAPTRAGTRRCASTTFDRERPARVDRGDPGDAQDPLAARLGASTAARCRPAGGRDRRADPRLGGQGRRDGLHPSCTCGWARTRCRWWILTMRVHGVEGRVSTPPCSRS